MIFSKSIALLGFLFLRQVSPWRNPAATAQRVMYVSGFSSSNESQPNFYVDDWNGLLLFAGPAYIMNAYCNWEMDTNDGGELFSYLDDNGPYSSFLTCGLKQIFT